ncbi:shikimate kinase [Paenibacillus sp. J5C_2022]|uniref:shikimate kinase n=1 Tax=Paenibacillus sp. J5C2022 TaxID=2977129 RepID=UPI0021CFBD62|nr:shikimate kinase [Paenibacillus sp. J5C2022]MCU6713206.1 shikimate kinase [Paenibacillus sp. J5C2022]
MNIVLIGMPTAGKSTAGIILAKIIGYDFVDSDLLIQKQENRLLRQIIEQKGIEGFISIENRVNAALRVDHTVISTGGSVVFGKAAMANLKDIGTVVYLKLSYETIKKRLENAKRRGVVIRENQSLHDLYHERCPLYECYADVTIDAESLNVEQLVQKLQELGDDSIKTND